MKIVDIKDFKKTPSSPFKDGSFVDSLEKSLFVKNIEFVGDKVKITVKMEDNDSNFFSVYIKEIDKDNIELSDEGYINEFFDIDKTYSKVFLPKIFTDFIHYYECYVEGGNIKKTTNKADFAFNFCQFVHFYTNINLLKLLSDQNIINKW